jgi:large subunit ribosomal protein L4
VAEKPSTKAALAGLRSITERDKVLVVLGRDEVNAWLSLRNLPEVHLLHADQLNTYDVVNSEDVVFTKAAFDAFVAGPAKKAAAVEDSAADDNAAEDSAEGSDD